MANRKLKPIERKDANVEAERGETVITSLFGPNVPEHYIIEGEKHSKGGTPLSLPKDSFIYSNSKNLRITDPDVLKMFDMPTNKVGYTPAEIAKQYDVNKYKEILLNPKSSKMDKDTATLMLNNMFDKLSALALYQESMKGFPDGIPPLAISYLEKNGIDPRQLVDTSNGQQQEQQEQPQAELGMSVPSYGVPIVDQTYSDIMNYKQKDPILNTTNRVMMNDVVPVDKQHTNNTDNKDDNKNDKKLIETRYDVRIPFGITAMVDSFKSVLNRFNEARQQRQMEDQFSGEERDSYTGASLGDYVDTGTQYGQFRPQERVYAVNPQNIISNDTRTYGSGGPVTDEEKEKVIKDIADSNHISYNDIVFVDDPNSADIKDDGKVYITKDRDGKFKVIRRTNELDSDTITNDRIANAKKLQEKLSIISDLQEETAKKIDSKINELKDKISKTNDKKEAEQLNDDILKLIALKKLNHTNSLISLHLAKNINDNTSADDIAKNFINNQSDFDGNTYLKKIRDEYSNDKNIIDQNDISKIQDLYKNKESYKDFLDRYGLNLFGYGPNEKGEQRSISPIDNWFGNTTGAYGAYFIKNGKKLEDLNYTSTPDVDTSKIKDKPTEKKSFTPFFTQDILNLANAISEKANIKKYLPYAEVPDVFLPEATYVSPERALAANQESANMIYNAASTLGTPQSLAATAAIASGLQMANNANIVAQNNAQNVGIANQFDMTRNNMLNNAEANRSNIHTNLYDKTVIANQQFDNAMRMAQRNIIAQFNNAWTNRGNAETMNNMSPYFYIDPLTYTTYRKENNDELKPNERKDMLDEAYRKGIEHINNTLQDGDERQKAIAELSKRYSEELFKSYSQQISPTKMTYNPYLYNLNNFSNE